MRDTDSTIRHGVTRRDTLKLGAAGLTLAALPWALASAQEPAPQQMRMRAIPATEQTIPVMGMGSSGSYATQDPDTLADLTKIMRLFVKMGGRVIDTSPTYGNAETNIGDIARETGLRDELFMATKVHDYGREAGIEQMQRSIELLDEPIDLMQVHNLVDLDTQWATLKRWKAEGRVRYIGITHYLTRAFDELAHHMTTKDMDFVQFSYSVMTPEAEQRLLPLARDRGIAVLVNRAFNDGRFFSVIQGQPLPDYAAEFDCESWAQFALKYVLGNEAVTCVIPATSDPEHLRDNMAAGYGELPDAAMQQRMRETIAAL